MKELEKTLRLERLDNTTRLWLLGVHAFGLIIVGLGFTFDYFWSDRLLESSIYHPLVLNKWIGIPWLVLPLIAGTVVIVGVSTHKRKHKLVGMLLTTGWYFAQVCVFVVASIQERINLLAPLLIYAGVLFPVSIVHTISVWIMMKVERELDVK